MAKHKTAADNGEQTIQADTASGDGVVTVTAEVPPPAAEPPAGQLQPPPAAAQPELQIQAPAPPNSNGNAAPGRQLEVPGSGWRDDKGRPVAEHHHAGLGRADRGV